MPIPGAAIATGTASGVTDRAGQARFTLPTGKHSFRVTPVGFLPESLAVFVGVGMTTVTVALHHKAAPVDGPVVVTPREHRTADAPTNVEVSDRDAIEAQLDRSPGTVSEVLAGVGGVRDPDAVGRVRGSGHSDSRHARPVHEDSLRRLAALRRHAGRFGPAPDSGTRPRSASRSPRVSRPRWPERRRSAASSTWCPHRRRLHPKRS